MNVYETIFVIGAGASMQSGMPNLMTLANILWKIFDDNPQKLLVLKQKISSCEKTSKKIIGNDFNNIKNAFDLIDNDSILLKRFKEMFIEQSKVKSHNSSFHLHLAELLHCNKISKIISMNWDNLLETSWRQLYGTDIDEDILIKPHGDVNKPDEKWILPNSDGFVSKELELFLKTDNKKPLNIVIVGYSENDSVIKKAFIDKLESSNNVYRVNPNCIGENAIPMSANEFIKTLSKEFKTSYVGWDYLNFDDQKNIDDLIICDSITHLNSKNTPRFSIFNNAYRFLSNNNYVNISGNSGTGKTMLAYQLAYELNRDNYEVLKFKEISKFDLDISPRFKTAIIVDNANNYPDVAEVIKKLINSKLKAIFVFSLNEDIGNYKNDFFVIKCDSVKSLYDFFVENKRVLEKCIRDNYNVIDEFHSYDRLINYAKRQESSYKFMYLIKGKENRIKESVNLIKKSDNFDSFAFIALYQIINVDGFISKKRICKAIKEFDFPFNVDFSLLKSILKTKNNNQSFAFNHLQEAYIYLHLYLSDKDYNYNKFKIMFLYLINTNCYLFIGIGNFFDSIKTYHKFNLNIDEKVNLINTMSKRKTKDDGILYAIDEISWAENEILDIEKELIVNIVNSTKGKNDIYYFGDIINSLHNIDISLEKGSKLGHLPNYFYEKVDFKRIVHQIDICSLSDLPYYVRLVERSCYALPDDIWKKSFGEIDTKEFKKKIVSISCDDIYGISLICGCFSSKGLDSLSYSLIEQLVKLLYSNVIKVLDSISEEFYYDVLGIGFMDEVLDGNKYDEARKKIVNAINIEKFIGELENIYSEDTFNLYKICILLNSVDSKLLDMICKKINYVKMAESSAYFINDDSFDKLLTLFIDDNDEYGSKFLKLNEDKLDYINPITMIHAPKFCIEWIRQGKRVELFTHYIPSTSIYAIFRLADFDISTFELLFNLYKKQIISFLKESCVDHDDYNFKKSFYDSIIKMKGKIKFSEYSDDETNLIFDLKKYNMNIVNN